MGKLNNKVAVITGGSTGIGLATAKTFLAEGAKVVITGRTKETLDAAVNEINDNNLLAVQSDTAQLDQIDALVEQVSNTFGKVDILFANAGIAWFAPIDQVDEAFFDAHFSTNVKGLFFTIQKFLKIFNDNGSIVLNASAVIHKGFENGSVYSATKGAVRNLARSISTDLAPRGIRVNTVSPGPIETPIYGKMGMTEEQLQGMAEGFAQMVPMKRFGASDEVAKAVLFLASDDSSFVLGEEILVDGGIATI